jgi:hypothetical protein
MSYRSPKVLPVLPVKETVRCQEKDRMFLKEIEPILGTGCGPQGHTTFGGISNIDAKARQAKTGTTMAAGASPFVKNGQRIS